MKSPLKRVLVAVALAAWSATGVLAQQASAADEEAVNKMFPCLAEGLPSDWQRLEVTVELDLPGAATGSVSYKFASREAQPSEDFRPCDAQQPAEAMLELRAKLAPERRGWVRARLSLKRDGSFGLKYDYAK